jgi:hypothetical protein
MSINFEMVQETLIDDNDPSKGNVAIRVGFHCGPVGEFYCLSYLERAEAVVY